MLVLNATTLNTGHNWQFTSTWMGESPFSIDEEIDGNWRLRHADRIRMGRAFVEGDFAWCVKNRNRLPNMQEFVNLSQQQIRSVDNYHIAATLTYFFFHGADESRQLQYLSFYDPAQAACRNPFASLRKG